MSEIPYVNRLGDAIEDAVAAPERARRRRRRPGRRFGGLAVAAFLLGAGGVTVAAVLDDPEKLATRSIACYDRASLEADVAVPGVDARPPAELCADVLQTGAPLAVCVRAESIAVFPGPADTCARLGLRPVPETYAAARDRLAVLSRELRELEDGRDCIEPDRLARRAQAVLGRRRWEGWRAIVGRGDLSGGPCGWIHLPGGDGRATLGGALDAERRELLVSAGPPRSLFRRLYGEGSAADRLFEASGERCFTVEELRSHARDRLGGHGDEVAFVVDTTPQPASEQLEPPARQQRYDEGCAVVTGTTPVYPSSGAVVIEVAMLVKTR